MDAEKSKPLTVQECEGRIQQIKTLIQKYLEKEIGTRIDYELNIKYYEGYRQALLDMEAEES